MLVSHLVGGYGGSTGRAPVLVGARLGGCPFPPRLISFKLIRISKVDFYVQLIYISSFNIWRLFGTILYCIVLCNIVLYCAILYCAILYNIVQFCIVQYCTILYCIILYCIVHCTLLPKFGK